MYKRPRETTNFHPPCRLSINRTNDGPVDDIEEDEQGREDDSTLAVEGVGQVLSIDQSVAAKV